MPAAIATVQGAFIGLFAVLAVGLIAVPVMGDQRFALPMVFLLGAVVVAAVAVLAASWAVAVATGMGASVAYGAIFAAAVTSDDADSGDAAIAALVWGAGAAVLYFALATLATAIARRGRQR